IRDLVDRPGGAGRIGSPIDGGEVGDHDGGNFIFNLFALREDVGVVDAAQGTAVPLALAVDLDVDAVHRGRNQELVDGGGAQRPGVPQAGGLVGPRPVGDGVVEVSPEAVER